VVLNLWVQNKGVREEEEAFGAFACLRETLVMVVVVAVAEEDSALFARTAYQDVPILEEGLHAAVVVDLHSHTSIRGVEVPEGVPRDASVAAAAGCTEEAQDHTEDVHRGEVHEKSTPGCDGDDNTAAELRRSTANPVSASPFVRLRLSWSSL
jgi:hypothetical protein